jgi:hypothetical protein
MGLIMIKKWIATTARRIINKAKSASLLIMDKSASVMANAKTSFINRRIESVYRQRQKLIQHQRIEREMLAKQHAYELARMDKQIANREAKKHRLNGEAFANERGMA